MAGDAVNTPGEETVTPESTTPAPVVSAPKKSDPEARIAALMSEKDRVIHEKAQVLVELVNARKELEEVRKHHQQLFEGATKATEDALKQAQSASGQSEQLQAEVTKLRLLMSNPDLQPYANVIPASTDEKQIMETIEVIRKARESDRTVIVEQLKAGTVPAANPPRTTVKADAASVQQYLRGAFTDPQEFQRRLQDVIQSMKK